MNSIKGNILKIQAYVKSLSNKDFVSIIKENNWLVQIIMYGRCSKSLKYVQVLNAAWVCVWG